MNISRLFLPLVCVSFLAGDWSLLTKQALADDANETQKPRLNYVDHLVPVLRESCFGCHNPDRSSGGLNLTTYAALMTGGSSGSVVSPGDPGASHLYQLVTHAAQPAMPLNASKLPDAKLEIFRQWIEDGALENSGSKPMIAKRANQALDVSALSSGKPEGPPPMPPQMLLEPVIKTTRSTAVTALVGSPWAPLVAVAGQQQVLLYDTNSLELLGILPFPEGIPYVLKFSRNGKLLLAAGGRAAQSGRVVVWDITTGERVIEVGDEYDAVLAADISPDQSKIALGGSGKVVRVFSTATGEMLYDLRKHTEWIYSLEFSPDNALLATADRNGGVIIWEAAHGQEYLVLAGHQQPVTDLSWRIDGNLLATSSEDGTTKTWEMEEGKQIRSWNAHGGGVLSVEFAKDGRLATCGRDGIARIWKADYSEERALEHMGDIAVQVAWNDDHTRIIAGNWQGDLRVWNAADGTNVGSLTSNPPLLAERLTVATQQLTAQQAEQQKLAAAVETTQAALNTLTTQRQAQEKQIAELTEAQTSTQKQIETAQQTADKASGLLVALEGQIQSKQPVQQAAAELAVKAKATLDAFPADEALAVSIQQLLSASESISQQMAQTAKLAEEQKQVRQQAQEQQAGFQQSLKKLEADLAKARQTLEQQTAQAGALNEQLAAEKALLEPANAALAAAQQQVDRWNNAIAFAAEANQPEPPADASAMVQ